MRGDLPAASPVSSGRMKRLLLSATAAASLGCGSMIPGPWTTSCIARGSRVRTPSGLRLIEDLREGDEIISVDPAAGEQVRTVITHVRAAHRECVRLAFAEDSLVVTSDHPLYDPDAQAWAPAGDWALGLRTHVLQAGDGVSAPVALLRAESSAGMHDVFDLGVAHALHNFVANGVLVHNKEPLPVQCAGPAGGEIYDYGTCDCPDGAKGTTRCPHDGDAGTCECPSDELDAGTGNGGTPDGGP